VAYNDYNDVVKIPEDSMITVTEEAKKELKKLLETKVNWPGARLRLLERHQGTLGLGIDIAAATDEVVEYEGDGLLIIDAELARRVNVVLDVDYTPRGAELVIS